MSYRIRVLTPKQQRFVDEYLIDLNATQAAIRTGYSAKTAGQAASRLLKVVKISAAIAARQQKVAVDNEITIESHLQRLAELAEGAQKAGQFSAAIAAEVNRGKVAGLYIERTEDVTGLSKDQRRERLLKLVG